MSTQAAATLAERRGLAGPRRAAPAEVRHRHGRAAGRELQRQPGVGARHARRAGAHRAGPGGRRLLALGDMRELGEGADAYHAGLAEAVAASGAAQVFLCGPHMRGAVATRSPPAQRGVHRPDSAALAGEVAAALQARRCDRGQGFAGLENESMSSTPSWRQAAARRDAKMFYNLLYPAGRRLQPVQPVPLPDLPLDRGVPDGAGPELPDRRRADPLAAQQAGRRASRSATTARPATS